MRTPEDVAAEVVSGLSFLSNRMVNGRLVGEQYFAAKAIVDVVKRERAEIERLRKELFRIQCEQIARATDKRRSAKRLRDLAMETRNRIIEILSADG